tara:strand:+ start:4496 stop:4819 length:324 start_codon:yes stop_codon:yes gene_type:complete
MAKKHRFMMLEDLVQDDRGTDILSSIGIYGTKHFIKKPEHCDECGSSKIEALEVLGASTRPLFWECRMCEKLWLIYTKLYTEVRLNKMRGTYSNPNDWGPGIDKQFN